MKYSFKKFGEHSPLIFSSESLYVDGVCLEERIEGFRTLSVIGRGIIPLEIEFQNFVHTTGGFVRRANRASRTIEVKYRISAKDNEDLLRQHSLLNSIFVNKCKISFADDLGYYYNAYLSGASSPPHGSLKYVGTLEFLVPTPYKYSYEFDTYNVNKFDTFSVPIRDSLPITPFEIRLYNYAGHVTKGDPIYIDFGEGEVITIQTQQLNGEDVFIYPRIGEVVVESPEPLTVSDRYSNLEDVKVISGGFIKTSAGFLTVVVDRRLI